MISKKTKMEQFFNILFFFLNYIPNIPKMITMTISIIFQILFLLKHPLNFSKSQFNPQPFMSIQFTGTSLPAFVAICEYNCPSIAPNESAIDFNQFCKCFSSSTVLTSCFFLGPIHRFQYVLSPIWKIIAKIWSKSWENVFPKNAIQLNHLNLSQYSEYFSWNFKLCAHCLFLKLFWQIFKTRFPFCDFFPGCRSTSAKPADRRSPQQRTSQVHREGSRTVKHSNLLKHLLHHSLINLYLRIRGRYVST